MSTYDSFALLAFVSCTWYNSFMSQSPNVGAQIRKARLNAGLSQVALAIAIDVRERTVQTWEANDRTPRPAHMKTLADYLGQPVAFFYGDTDVALPEAA